MSWVWCLQFFSCLVPAITWSCSNLVSAITKYFVCHWLWCNMESPKSCTQSNESIAYFLQGCFMHQVNLWNTMWAWWLYLPLESDTPHVKSCIMLFSFMCLHNIIKLLLNKWQCLGCDACNFSPVLFLQSPDLAPILFLQLPNILSAIDFDVIWNHQSLVLSQMNQLHISFKVFYASSEFVKHHVSLMIVPSSWVGHPSCKKLHHALLFHVSSQYHKTAFE